jgi:hypothetical protein
MLLHSLVLFAANPYNVTASSIGVPTGTGSLGAAMANALKLLMALIGGLAVIFVIVGGIQYTVSGGNSKRTEQAKNTLLYAGVGIAVAIAGFALVTFIANAVNGGSKL